MGSQIPDERCGMPALWQPHVPALVEVWFRSQLAHRIRELGGEITLVADLEQLDLPHHTLPRSALYRMNSTAPAGSSTTALILRCPSSSLRPARRVAGPRASR